MGKCQKVYISTCGIGAFRKNSDKLQISSIKGGDRIILSGPIGEHGMCIMNERNHLVLGSSIISDCAPLNSLCSDILRIGSGVRIMRDPTRGGVANTLNELSRCSKMSMKLYEERIPVKKEVAEFFDKGEAVMEESDVCRKLIKLINKNSIRQINIMEVCGTHTRNIFKYCIDKLID
ncbi:AIR synthase-related protein, partial [Inconstantimicrobium porci]|uniref:AIR synthase-related protein n=1 Tax=Inconstantimicrobium porci TaxID=2652291 RepID=UPI0034DDE3F2